MSLFGLSGTRWITHKLNALQLMLDKFGIYLQHLQSMSEDKSFKSADRQKFKGWLRKWQQARIPLLACLFLEILSPAKMLSLAFQENDINPVSTIQHLETAKKQLDRLEGKKFNELPTVQLFLDKVKSKVTLPNFNAAKDSAEVSKGILLDRIKDAMQTRLEAGENKIVLMAATILNCEGWGRRKENGEEDLEFPDNCVADLFNHFQEPLLKAGSDGSLNRLLEQWHDLVAYTVQYLDPSRTHYLRVWKRIFTSSRKEEWNMVLLLVELLLSIPISNAKVERMFSLMNRVKTDSRAALCEHTLNNLVRIRMEGPPLEEFDPTPAIQLWASSANCSPNQRARKQYNSRDSAKRPKVLIEQDDSSPEESYDTDDNEENELIKELEDLE